MLDQDLDSLNPLGAKPKWIQVLGFTAFSCGVRRAVALKRLEILDHPRTSFASKMLCLELTRLNDF